MQTAKRYPLTQRNLAQALIYMLLMCMALAAGARVYAEDLKPIAVEQVGEGHSPWTDEGPGTDEAKAPPTAGVASSRGLGIDCDFGGCEATAAPAPAATLSPPPVPTASSNPQTLEEALPRLLAALEASNHQSNSRPFEPELWIPILAILLIFGGPIILVLVLVSQHHRARAKRDQQRVDTINRMLEAGRDIPPELLRDQSVQEPSRNLRKGLTNLGVGLGLLLFLTIFLGKGIGSVAYIIIGLGLSQLAVWKWLDSKQPLPKETRNLQD